jgi:hypothetical protein
MADRTEFAETSLTPIDKFYSSLTEETITTEDYDRAKLTWNTFNCKTLQDYHDLYLMTYVLLLADVFQNFRGTALNCYGLDPLHYLTLSSFSWDACLKMTGVQLELFTDEEESLFVGNNIRGGIATISHHLANANNKYAPETFNPDQPNSYITYLDCNN